MSNSKDKVCIDGVKFNYNPESALKVEMSKRNKIIREALLVVILVAVTVGLGLLIIFAVGYPAKALEACPPGTDNIGIDSEGNLICKNQPSGCPYGDNIPLDSPKCAAPPSQTITPPAVINSPPTDTSEFQAQMAAGGEAVFK